MRGNGAGFHGLFRLNLVDPVGNVTREDFGLFQQGDALFMASGIKSIRSLAIKRSGVGYQAIDFLALGSPLYAPRSHEGGHTINRAPSLA